MPTYVEAYVQFLSTPSARRATLRRFRDSQGTTYFYPRPPRGGRRRPGGRGFYSPAISIHALREEGDHRHRGRRRHRRISIHALREEGDTPMAASFSRGRQFLSTPSARRATSRATTMRCALPYFYPRPPRGGRPCGRVTRWTLLNFYPRPPRGGRLSRSTSKVNRSVFLSTPSARRATIKAIDAYLAKAISIHALREEGDNQGHRRIARQSNFYPRPPRGGRQARGAATSPTLYFYPRPPRGGRPLPAGTGLPA